MELKPFDKTIAESNLYPLKSTGINTLQVNVGKLCNQVCRHCHVDAGPGRKEVMTRETLELCLDILRDTDIPTVDITGGAPEMNPDFRWFVEECRKLGRHVMIRTNLTILSEPGYEDMPRFFAENKVEVIASLPYYMEQNTDSQRGRGVFKKSIESLKRLNSLGYGREGSGLTLDIVFNPGGAFLPPSQKALEADYKREMQKRYGISFNNLFTITNLPVGRFLAYLNSSGNFEMYMNRLVSSFNPLAAANAMCRDILSVGWDGTLYDCDFNQMLGLSVNHGVPSHIRDFDLSRLSKRQIVTGLHCYGCTAGAGSSCGGATT
ncbi:MAG: arsenosugar biosynthesis radical SAM protein ArsS [Deltaproteobacteria bacterium]|nr:arsenosugar biosynthesis radical SAM protein ArsS [Deltaproteobacteria bacterium]